MTYASTVAADNPVFWWKLDEASGSALTGSGSAADDGTLTFTPTYHAASLLQDGSGDYSMQFDGVSGHYASLTAASVLALNTSSFTIELIIRPTNAAAGTPKGVLDVSGEQIMLRLSDAGYAYGVVQCNFGTLISTSGGTLVNNLSYHLVATYDASNGATKLYVNGVQVGSTTNATGGLGAKWNGILKFPYNNSDGRVGAGRYQHLAIYNTAFDSTKVVDHLVASGLNSMTVDAPTTVAATASIPKPLSVTADVIQIAANPVNATANQPKPSWGANPRPTVAVVAKSMISWALRPVLAVANVTGAYWVMTEETYRNAVASDSPVLWWELNEDGGLTLTDLGSGHHNGTLSTSTGITYHRPTLLVNESDYTMGFNGSSGLYGSLTNASVLALQTSSFSFEVMVKPSNLGDYTYRGMFDINGAAIDFHIGNVSYTSGRVEFGAGIGTGISTLVGKVVNGTAYHLVATYDASTGAAKIYINGTEAASGTWSTGGAGTRWNGAFKFPWRYTNGQEMAGDFQHAAIYSKALTPAQVYAHYARALITINSTAYPGSVAATTTVFTPGIRTNDYYASYVKAAQPLLWYKFDETALPTFQNYGWGGGAAASAIDQGYFTVQQNTLVGDGDTSGKSVAMNADETSDSNAWDARFNTSTTGWYQYLVHSSFSIEMVVKPIVIFDPSQVYETTGLWDSGEGYIFGGIDYYYNPLAGGILFFRGYYWLYVNSSDQLIAQKNYHIVFTYDTVTGVAKIYVNGEKWADSSELDEWGYTQNWPSGLFDEEYWHDVWYDQHPEYYPNGHPFDIGNYYGGSGPQPARYQHFAIYNYALSANDITNHFTAAKFDQLLNINEPVYPLRVKAKTYIWSPSTNIWISDPQHPSSAMVPNATASIPTPGVNQYSLYEYYVSRDNPLLWWKMDDPSKINFGGSSGYRVQGYGSFAPAYNKPASGYYRDWGWYSTSTSVTINEPGLVGSAFPQGKSMGFHSQGTLIYSGYYTTPTSYTYGLPLQTSSFTIEFVYKPTKMDNYRGIFNIGSRSIYINQNYTNSNVYMGYDGSSKLGSDAATTPINQRSHVAFTYNKDTGQAIFWLNGQFGGSATFMTGGMGARWSSGQMYVGYDPSNGLTFDGYLQHFAIYDFALSQAQVLEHSNIVWASEGVIGPSATADMLWVLQADGAASAVPFADGLMTYAYTSLPNAITSVSTTYLASAEVRHGNAVAYLEANVELGSNEVPGAALYMESNVTTDVPEPQIWKVVSPTAQPGDEFTVYLFGVGTSSATYDAHLYATIGGSAIEIIPTSWTFVDSSSAVDLPTRTINPITGQIDTQYVVITATIPEGASTPGFPVTVTTTGSPPSGGGDGSYVGVGGTAFASVLGAPADPTIGWWIEIYDHRFPTIWLERFETYSSLAFTDTLDDVGMGSVTFAADDPIVLAMDAGSGITAPGGVPAGTWTSTSPDDKLYGTGTYHRLLEGSHYWRIMQGGQERFRFIHEGTKKERVKSEGPEMITVSGRGRGCELEWGIVLPEPLTPVIPGVPFQKITYVHYNKQRVFKNTSWSVAFQTLLDEAQQRGEMSNELRVSFTHTEDSRLIPWTDQADYVADIGQNLLAQLNLWAAQVGFEWHINPDGLIEAAIALGENRSGTAIFVEGLNIKSAEDIRNTESLRSAVYVEGSDNRFSGLSDIDAWIRWGNRATYVKSQDVVDARGRAMVAASSLSTMKEPDWTRTFDAPVEIQDPVSGAVLSAAQGFPRAFSDYRVTDTIGYQGLDSTNETLKVVEMGIAVDENGEAKLELALMTRFQQWAELQKRLLKKFLAGSYTTARTPFNSNPAIDGLHDVNLTAYDDPAKEPVGPLHGATMRLSYDEYGRVMPGQNQWVPSPGEPTFFFSGYLQVIGPTSRWYAHSPGRASRVHVSLGINNGSTLTIGLWRNGKMFDTVSTTGGNIYKTIDEVINSGDYLQVSIQACSTQQAWLTVQWTV